MGLMYEYFAASSDEAAAEVVHIGPGGPEPASPVLREALRAGDRDAIRLAMRPKVRLSDADVLVLAAKGIEPVVQMGKLEALLTSCQYNVLAGRPRAGHLVAEGGQEGPWVVTLTDEIQAALGAASPERIAAVAHPWSEGEEFYGRGDPESLAAFLLELAGLARQASQRGERLYCWMCL